MDRLDKNCMVSVIIPVYKVEKYLEESVNSVLNQTYENIEIILVDDGSPDNCPEICDRLAQEHSNIQVVHKENGGSSSARNVGIDAINTATNYVLFLDSDDQLMENAIEGMLEKALETKAEMVIPDRYTKVYEDSKKQCEALHFTEQMYIEEPKEFATKVLIEQGRAWRAHSLLYSYEAIQNSGARFPEGYIGEDFSFNLAILSYVKKIIFYPCSTVLHLERANSITTTFHTDFEKNIWYMDEQARDFLKRANVDTETNRKRVDALLCRNMVTYLFSIMSKKNSMSYDDKKQKSRMLLSAPHARNVIREKHVLPYFESPKTRFAIKVAYFLLRHKQDGLVMWILSKV